MVIAMSDLSVLFKLKTRVLKNALLSVKRESSLKVLVVVLFASVYIAGSFALFFEGFSFVRSFTVVGDILLDKLLELCLFAFFVMIFISSILSSYGVLYRGKETDFLMAMPVSELSHFTILFCQSFILSCWALVFLGVPLFLAYGLVGSRHLSFYIFLIIGLLGMAVTASSLGAAVSVAWARRGRRIRAGWIASAALSAVVVGWIMIERFSFGSPAGRTSLALVNKLLAHMRFADCHFLPSYWAYAAATGGSPGGRLFYILLIYSTCFMMLWVLFSLAEGGYCRGLARRGDFIRSRSPGLASRAIDNMVSYFPGPFDRLISKEVKLFLRDPAQWSQYLMFFGLLFVYIANLRNLPYDLDSIFWKRLISFLNFMAMALITGTLTSRFAFPQLSLEGNRFWLLVTSPLSLRKVLLTKFWLSFAVIGVLTQTITVLSSWILRVPFDMAVVNSIAMALVVFALVGLSIGLGAIYPRMGCDDPSVIVSGFGGSLVLIISTAYIIAVAALLVCPFYLSSYFGLLRPGLLLIAGLVSITALSAVVCLVPMAIGLRRLERPGRFFVQ